MGTCSRGALAAILGMTVALVGASAAVGAPAIKKCAKGKVTRVVNGKRTCVAPGRFRPPATPPGSPVEELVDRVLSGGPVPLRLRSGARPAPPLSRATVTRIAAAYAKAETDAIALLRGALARTTNARPHEIGFTGGTVNRSADGSAASANVGFGGTAGNVAVTGNLNFTANASGRLDVGVDITATQPDGSSKTVGLTGRDILARSQECPDASGNLPISRSSDVTSRNAETFGSKRVRLGAVREAVTTVSKSRGQVKFGPDGKARPFPVTVTVNYDSSRSATALAFFGSRQRAVASGTMTGTLDPATGKLTNVTVTSKAKTSGFTGTQAAADAAYQKLIEQMLKDELGRLLEDIRKAEKNCTGPFDVTLAITTDANFATHSARGTLNATITTTKNAAGEFTGSAPVSYQGVTFTTKTQCPYIDQIATAGTIDVKIVVQPDGFLKVTWSPGNVVTSASVDCPPSGPGDPDPPPMPGQVGPQLIQPSPTEFTLVNTGGQRAIGGGFTDAGDGWTHSGTITVTRKV